MALAKLTCLSLILGLLLVGHAQNAVTLTSSTVTYHGSTPNETWDGQAPLQSLTLTPGADELSVHATLEPGQFSSGNFIRDANARFVVFESGEYPTASLTGTLPLRGDLATLESGTATFSGELTIHGVTRALSFPVTLERSGNSVSAEASFPVSLSAYGMKRPSLFGLLVDDSLTVDVALSVELPGP